MMKLWLLTRTDPWGYDDYDAAIVAAESEDAARTIHPGGHGHVWRDGSWMFCGRPDSYSGWTSPDNVNVKLLGDPAPGIEPGVILASFNAG